MLVNNDESKNKLSSIVNTAYRKFENLYQDSYQKTYSSFDNEPTELEKGLKIIYNKITSPKTFNIGTLAFGVLAAASFIFGASWNIYTTSALAAGGSYALSKHFQNAKKLDEIIEKKKEQEKISVSDQAIANEARDNGKLAHSLATKSLLAAYTLATFPFSLVLLPVIGVAIPFLDRSYSGSYDAHLDYINNTKKDFKKLSSNFPN